MSPRRALILNILFILIFVVFLILSIFFFPLGFFFLPIMCFFPFSCRRINRSSPFDEEQYRSQSQETESDAAKRDSDDYRNVDLQLRYCPQCGGEIKVLINKKQKLRYCPLCGSEIKD